MKTRPFLLALVTALSLAATASDPPGVKPLGKEWTAWNAPFEPFRIAGNLHYVGTVELAAYAIRTPKGVILIDTGFHQSVPGLVANLHKLGMKPTDVKIILTSHAHADHVGGVAKMKKLTGATLAASAEDAKLMARGGLDDPNFGDDLPFPPVQADRILADGETVELGGTTLTARITPGHTAGCTTWTMAVEEGGKRFEVVFGCSYTAPGYQLVANRRYPRITEDFRATFSKLRTMPCDIQLASHASFMDLAERRAAQRVGNALAFVDPARCRDSFGRSEAAFEKELEAQRRRAGR